MSRLTRIARGILQNARAHPWANPVARRELERDHRDRHPVGDHLTHLDAALEWLCRAQDATPDDGFARGYSIAFNPYFGSRGWQASYPETTGYIIPTLLEAAHHLDRPDLEARALRAARWERAIQLGDGAVQGGVIGQGRSPAVFNTGQVMLGWLAAFERSGDEAFADSAIRAGEWLTASQDDDGLWRKGNSQFALAAPTLYNARVAWALAEVGTSFDRPAYRDAAQRNLAAVAERVAANGWIPDCCLTDPSRPLLHTLAYAVRGLIEGGRVLGESTLVAAGARTATRLAETVREDGWMAGRFDRDWRPIGRWSCLTGQAQMCNNWIRLHLITGDPAWLAQVPAVLGFVKSTQNRSSADLGLMGGVKGSWPLDGDYGRFELLNWATKYLADALLRSIQLDRDQAADRAHPYRLG